MKSAMLQRMSPAASRPGGGGQPTDVLTDRELEVFQLLGQGLGVRQIAEMLLRQREDRRGPPGTHQAEDEFQEQQRTAPLRDPVHRCRSPDKRRVALLAGAPILATPARAFQSKPDAGYSPARPIYDPIPVRPSNQLAMALRDSVNDRVASLLLSDVSGGLDSTHALIVCCRAANRRKSPAKTYWRTPCRGSRPSRKKEQAWQLMSALNVSAHEIDIRPSCMQMLRDIGHPFAEGEPVHDVTFENVQAGERHLAPVPPRQSARRNRRRNRRPLRAGPGLVHLRRGRSDVALSRQRISAQDIDPTSDPLAGRSARPVQGSRRRVVPFWPRKSRPELVPCDQAGTPKHGSGHRPVRVGRFLSRIIRRATVFPPARWRSSPITRGAIVRGIWPPDFGKWTSRDTWPRSRNG